MLFIIYSRIVNNVVENSALWRTYLVKLQLYISSIIGYELKWAGLRHEAPLGPGHTLSCMHTHAYRHRHRAKQSSAYPGMPGWVPPVAREEQHAAFERLHTDTHTHWKKKQERALTSVTGSSSGNSYVTLDQNSHMLFLWCDCSFCISQQHQSSITRNQEANALSRLQWT